jgi:glycosyltransferase involved in cell wall biosynthesis
MATGLPVVATNVGGVPEIVRHGKTGFLAPGDDTKAQLDAINQLVENSDLRTEMGARARAYVEDVHSVHRLPVHLSDLYDLAFGKDPKSKSEIHPFSGTPTEASAPALCLPQR